ncbi:hypothetical protein NHX12_004157 [Muraenolepis orangiensis]|uniref:Uncharacterized protein n=1 Tax=Muraenolepis orangiensis TaxID=630683 RepID=A0A9Q0IBX0_9TELE|nr:hypothetical protein NHX12_004157 [Muraenolepis orangiensis]
MSFLLISYRQTKKQQKSSAEFSEIKHFALLVGTPPAAVGLERLTRRHAVKLSPGLNGTVEECSLAVGAVVGHDGVKSASRMNNAVVIVLDSVDKVNVIVEQGVVVQDSFTPCFH